MDDKKIIEALGGSAKLGRKLGLGRQTVQAWKHRGIPPKWRLSHMALFKRGERMALGKNT